jgi:hypothetical protein
MIILKKLFYVYNLLYVYEKVFRSIKQWAKYDEVKSSWLNASHNTDYETITKISMTIDLAFSD